MSVEVFWLERAVLLTDPRLALDVEEGVEFCWEREEENYDQPEDKRRNPRDDPIEGEEPAKQAKETVSHASQKCRLCAVSSGPHYMAIRDRRTLGEINSMGGKQCRWR